jgi:tripartite-type tricarboxylate transporter receptor subunit TctC
MTEPEMKEKLINLGFELVIVKPDTFQQEISEELKTWKDLLGKIKLNEN